MEGDRKPWVFLKTQFSERGPQFSPDGRWVAYMSNESERPEIYVRPFVVPAASGANRNAANASGQWQISTAGGIYPRWRPDGKELYYLAPDGQMMAAPIRATATTLEPGAPKALFPTHVYGGGSDNQQGRQYDVAPDGRFLINTVPDDLAAAATHAHSELEAADGEVSMELGRLRPQSAALSAGMAVLALALALPIGQEGKQREGPGDKREHP